LSLLGPTPESKLCFETHAKLVRMIPQLDDFFIVNSTGFYDYFATTSV
jgi:hypothetical protein